MDRTEALTGVLTAAEQLLRCVDLPRQIGTPTLSIPVGVVQQLASAVGAVGSAEVVTGDVSWDQPVPAVQAGICQGDPDCWRYADLPTGTCHHHSPMAHAPQVRRRDSVFDGAADA